MSDFSSSSSVTKATTSQFRAKIMQMKAWEPAHPPSNRDRLELYALHKQAVSSDIPTHMTTATYLASLSLPEKTKMNAWRLKKGMPRSQAISLYIQESDRQLRVYGSAKTDKSTDGGNPSVTFGASTAISSNPSKSKIASPPLTDNPTPANTPTPANNKNGNGDSTTSDNETSMDLGSNNANASTSSAPGMGMGGNVGGNGAGVTGSRSSNQVLLTPRGLAAVPLLCAAAAETRFAYLSRLANTSLNQGWWAKQEPLCADLGTFLALPEIFVLQIASTVEWISLRLIHDNNNNLNNNPQQQSQSQLNKKTSPKKQSPPQSSSSSSKQQEIVIFSPTIVQSFLWPLHNTLLAIWIVIIFLCTIFTTAFLSLRAIFLGTTPFTNTRSTSQQSSSYSTPNANQQQSQHLPNCTQMSLSTLFNMEILPACNAATSLCDYHQAVSIRILGLIFMPYVSICQMSQNISNSAIGIWFGGIFYCMSLGCTWWYWSFVVPWFAFTGVLVSLSCGWCFALIDMAGVSHD